MKASVYVLNMYTAMYPTMVFGDHEGECVCVCVLKIYPAMVSCDNEGECLCVCVEVVSSYCIW